MNNMERKELEAQGFYCGETGSTGERLNKAEIKIHIMSKHLNFIMNHFGLTDDDVYGIETREDIAEALQKIKTNRDLSSIEYLMSLGLGDLIPKQE